MIYKDPTGLIGRERELEPQSPCRGFRGGSVVKNLLASTGDAGSNPWIEKVPWRRERQPTPIFLPGESHGQRSLGGYSPRGGKDSDTTEQLGNNKVRASVS